MKYKTRRRYFNLLKPNEKRLKKGTFEKLWTNFVTASLKIDGFSKMPANSLNSSIFRNLN